MRPFVVATLLLAMTFVAYAAAEPPLFQQANAKYQAGDFKGASELYQRLTQTGQASASVYYNCGNAALKSGQKGQALVYYERALKISPRDKDLLWNVRILRESFPDRIDDTSYFVVAAFREFLGEWTADEIALGFSVFLALLAFLNVLYFFVPALKTWTGWIRGLAAAGLLLLGVLFAFKGWEIKDPRVVVLDKEAYAYYGPSESETKAFLLHEGASGKVIDESNDWIYVLLPNKKMGWIRKNSCETI